MRLSPDAIFQPFRLKRAKTIVAAVSGGSDSLATLFLLRDYLTQIDNPPSLIAVTIDHRLRGESTKEAENVGLLCQKHGITHRIRAWDDVKPTQGIAAAARSARYRLLVEAAREVGAGIIITGHTQNDQIETFLMRKERSHHSEARGLAAMASRSWLEGSIELVRPMLAVSRLTLRNELISRNIGWVDDPSNTNTDYERPRVRLGAAADADPHHVMAQVELASAVRKRDNGALVAALADPASLRLSDDEALEIDAAIYALLPENVQRLFSGLVASLAGGRRFLPGDSERSRIARLFSGAEKQQKLTVFGALIERGQGGLPHRFRRERRNLAVSHLPAQGSCIWDGRYRFYNSGEYDLEVGAPDRQALNAFLLQKCGDVEIASRFREALLTLPAIFENGKIIALPFLTGPNLPETLHMERHFALFDHVLPGYDFALARAVERRIGRKCADNFQIL